MRPLILFDMDGTLLNSVPAIGESCNRALAENGLPQYPIPPYNGMVGNGMRVLIGRACPAGAAEELRQKVLAAYDRIYTEECRKPGIIYPGIPQLLQRLRAQGVLTAVITNKPQPQADALRESTFHGMLDAIWGQREGFPLKPDPTLAQELIRELEARRTPEAERANVAAEILGAEIDRYRAGGTYAGEFPERWLPAGLAIVDEAFTEQNGLVNSTMKVVRGKVEEHFRNRLDYLYSAEGRSLKNPENLASLKKIVG